jgi:uncharacterized protein
VSEAGRIPELDALRGVALLGILVGNVMWFSGFAVAGPEARAALDLPAADALVELLVHAVVEGKFYSLFSLLFGAGFALALRHRSAHGFARRLAVLFAIGIVHGTLLWFGDIVSLYAVTGVALLGVVSWPPRRLVRAGIACLVAPVVLGGAWLLADTWWGTAVGVGYGPESLLGVFASGSYAEVLDANWVFLVDRWYLAVISARFPRILGMFLLGAAAIRADVLHRPADLIALAQRLLPIAVVANVALAVQGGGSPPRPPTLLGWSTDILACVGAPTGAIVYAIVIVIASRRAAWPWAYLRAAGRMSLTNYVAQSMVMVALFYGFGLGAWGRVGATQAVAIAVTVFAAQAIVSRAWLGRCEQGPLEWLWRRAVAISPRDSD